MNSGFFYKSAAEREKLVKAERAFITERVQKVIAFKKKLCDEAAQGDAKKSFVIVNQKVVSLCFETLNAKFLFH